MKNIERTGSVGEEVAPAAKGKFIEPGGGPAAAEIETGESSLKSEIVVVAGCQGFCGGVADLAAIVDRLAKAKGAQYGETA